MNPLESLTDGNSRPSGPPRVLVVDDHPTVRRLCTRILERDGYQVFEAADGQDALELARTKAIDLVLLDISMPVLDGFGVAAALREDKRTSTVPFIFVTAETDPLVKVRAFESGAKGFFEKPYDPSVLSAFVRRMLAHLVPSPGFSTVDS
jgi:DNA-binding response OmpR family regulator